MTRTHGVVAADGTSYDPRMSGAARRTTCLLPRLARRGWRPILFVSRRAREAFRDLPGVQVVDLPLPPRSATGSHAPGCRISCTRWESGSSSPRSRRPPPTSPSS